MIKKSVHSFLALVAVLACASAMAGPVNINAADSKTLADAIPGVGEKLGQAIVEYRRQNGPFSSVDDLSRVKGIGAKLIDKNRDLLKIDAGTGGAGAASSPSASN